MQQFETRTRPVVKRVSRCRTVCASLFAIVSLTAMAASDQGRKGPSWAPALALEQRADSVLLHAQAIDDAGNVTALFVQSDGTRSTLFTTRGSLGIDGTPTFSKPKAIDAVKPVLDSSTIAVAAAPNGNVVAAWISVAPCNDFTYKHTGNCNYLYTARYSGSTGKWAAPVIVGDTPGDAPTQMKINDAGDVLLKMTGWIPQGDWYTALPALAWRKHSGSSYAQQVFQGSGFSFGFLGLDADGDMTMSATYEDDQFLTKVAVYRGRVSGGLAEPEILDDGSAGRSILQSMSVGTGGQIVLVWDNHSRYAATASSSKAKWSIATLDMRTANVATWAFPVVVTDAGKAIVYDLNHGTYVTGSDGAWSKAHALPAGYPTSAYEPGISRNGSLLMVVDSPGGYYGGSGGAWLTYDAATGKITHALDTTSPGPGYVLGVRTSSNVNYNLPLLSMSGVGATIMPDDYDVLPSADDPDGIQGGTRNLWAALLH